jgi:hypothetical protein
MTSTYRGSLRTIGRRRISSACRNSPMQKIVATIRRCSGSATLFRWPSNRCSCQQARSATLHVVSMLVAFSSILVLALPVSAKTNRHTPQTTIRGVASDSSGKPLVGATVVLQTLDGRIVSSTAADRNGQFFFESRGPSDLIIVVNKPGYSTALSVPVNSGPLQITMEPESAGAAGGGGM